MLRFPLNQRVILITTAGIVSCLIVKAKEDFLFCKDVKYDQINLGSVYVDRKSVIGYSDDISESTEIIDDSNEQTKNLNTEIKKSKIIKFRNSVENFGGF